MNSAAFIVLAFIAALFAGGMFQIVTCKSSNPAYQDMCFLGDYIEAD